MAVESANKIHELNSAAPTGAEPLSEADDHLRVIKTSIKGSFPGFGVSTDSGVYTGGADELNSLASLIDGAGLNALTLGAGLTGTSYNGTAAVTAAVDFTDPRIARKVVVNVVNADATLGTDYANEVIVTDSATGHTYTVSNTLSDGDQVQIHNAGSVAKNIVTGGNTVRRLRGGSIGTGDFTLPSGGILTLLKVSNGVFHAYGGGI